MPPPDIPLPKLPEAPRPFTFPLIATLAPVVASLAMFAITRSPFALVFAFLGPMVAAGTLLDNRVQGRRRRRRERARYCGELAATQHHIEVQQSRLRESLMRSVRSAGQLLPAPLHDPERWRYSGGAVAVSLGVGMAASGIRLTGDGAPTGGLPFSAPLELDATLAESLGGLHESCVLIPAAPVIVDARLGIGVSGTGLPVLAAARGLIMQLAAVLPPDAFEMRGALEPWQRQLPHHRGASTERGRIEFVRLGTSAEPSGARVVVVVAECAEQLPRECRVGVSLAGGCVSIVRHPSMAEGADAAVLQHPLRAEFLSLGDATSFAATLREAAVAEGLGAVAVQPPESVPLAALPPAAEVAGSALSGLAAVFMCDAAGPVSIDLVSDGPHAVVGGTTGSGKSELLVSWVLALAASHSPQQVSFLLVDFKGGSSFGAVASLPHSVGLITDLDTASATRALESLGAELRHRERQLAECGARSIEELLAAGGAPLPRLVVVVDEFAAMIADFPELHALFADIAARGRSLGVHLILCTQRPGGVLRDSVMANCTLRLSLRVNNGADSTAVIGAPSAATLPPFPLGRCFLSVAGSEPRLAQVAVSDARDAARAHAAWPGAVLPRRPWLPPLPSRIALHTLEGAVRPHWSSARSIPIGLLDLPQEQRQPVCHWDPGADGNLLVLGGQASGKTSVLATVAEGTGSSAWWIPADIEAAWDALLRCEESGGIEQFGSVDSDIRVLLIDDVDALWARMPEAYQHPFLERLSGVMRDGPSMGLRVVLTAQRVTPVVQSLSTLCDARLVLRLPTRQEHVMAGGAASDHDPRMQPGAGWWGDRRVQVAMVSDAPTSAPGAAPLPAGSAAVPARRFFDPASGALVVTSRPGAFSAALAGHEPGVHIVNPAGESAAVHTSDHAVFVADPQSWQIHWGVLMGLRSRLPLLFDRCTAAQFRSISGSTALPPPLTRRPGGAWLLDSNGEVTRVQLPGGF